MKWAVTVVGSLAVVWEAGKTHITLDSQTKRLCPPLYRNPVLYLYASTAQDSSDIFFCPRFCPLAFADFFSFFFFLIYFSNEQTINCQIFFFF